MEESGRLAHLHQYQILDTEPEHVFDDIAVLARRLLRCAVGLVCLVDEDRQWFKAESGLTEIMGDLRETPREVSFCAHAINSDDVLTVEDMTNDPRFRFNPFVTEYPNVRSYAGAPLIMADGIRVGTVCVLDLSVRQYSEIEISALETLRDAAIAHIQLRREEPETYVTVCGWCKKLLQDVSGDAKNVRFTHGICTECAHSVANEPS